MKTAVSLVFLSLLAPSSFCQDTTNSRLSASKTEAAATQAPAKPAKPETPPAHPQEPASKSATKIDAQKEAAIRKLFEIQGTRKTMDQVISGMSANMKPTLSKMLPTGEYQEKLIGLFFEKFQAKLKVDDLLDMTIPIYDKYFSKEDIDGLTRFYQTPLGTKMISVMPQVLIESQSAAMSMGEQLGRQAMQEVLAEHPDLAKALEEAGAHKN